MTAQRTELGTDETGPRSTPGRPRQLAMITWTAQIGGAEAVMLSLAKEMQAAGTRVDFFVIGPPGPMLDRLAAAGVRGRALGFRRGRNVLFQPRRLAAAVAGGGPDGVLINGCGLLGAALRLGGYRAPIVAMEHGAILGPVRNRTERILNLIRRAAGAWADDAEVAVSDFVLERMRAEPVHARRLCRIHNSVDPEVLAHQPSQPSQAGSSEVVAGFAGRMIPGKGLDILLHALVQVRREVPVKLRVAGDGPDRNRIASLARALRVDEHVSFEGMVADVGTFWGGCDLAVVPSSAWIESFCMVALEAMACGKPVVATINGGLPEVVADGETGALVPAGDADALARAIVRYARSRQLRVQHGAAARERANDHFHVRSSVLALLEVYAAIEERRPIRRGRERAGPTAA